MVNIAGLGELVITVGGDLGPLESDLNRVPQLARQAGEAAAAALSGATTGGTAMAGAFDQAAQASTQLAGAMQGTTTSAEALDKELQTKQADAANAAQGFQELGKQLSDAGAAMALIGGALSVVSAGLVELGESSLMASGKMEQQRVAMENLTHSASQTDALIKDLVEFAIKTPFEIPGVMEMGQKLVAMGTATTDVIPLLRTLGDTASGSGKGFAGLNVLVNDFGKMSQLGTIHMRELNTLAYQGVPAIKALADAFGVSTNRMRQMVEQNLVSAADAMPILIKAMQDKFGGMMEAQSKTLLGMWSNFKDSITKTLIAIGDAIAPAFKSIITGLQPVLDAVQKLAEWFGQLPQPVQTAVVALGIFTVAIGPLVLGLGAFLFVAGNIITKLPALAALFGIELPAAMLASTTATAGLATAQGTLSLSAAAGRTAMLALNAAVSAGYDIIILATTGYMAFKAGEWLREQVPGVKAFFDQIADGIYATAGFKQLIDWIGGVPPVIAAAVKSEREMDAISMQLEDRLKAAGVQFDRVTTSVKANYDAVTAAARAAGLLGQAHADFTRGMGQTTIAVEQLKKAQAEANAEVERTRTALESVTALYRINEVGIGVLTRAQDAYTAALKKAHPELQGVTAEIDMQARAAQSTGAQMLKYLELWRQIPQSIEDYQAALEAGFKPETLIAKLRAMVKGWEDSGAIIDPVIKSMADDIIGLINQMNGFGDTLAQNAKAVNGWKASVDAATGITVWRESVVGADAATQGFTTTVVNGVTVIKGAKESLDGLSGSMKGLSGATKDAGEAWAFINGEWISATALSEKVSHAAGTVSKSVKELGGESSKAATSTKTHSNAMYDAEGNLNRYAGTATKAAKGTRDLSGGMYDAEGNIKAFGKGMYDAEGNLDAFASSASKMTGSFMEGMNGMTVSGEIFIAMLAQLGALSSDLEHAARAMGYIQMGQNNFMNEAGLRSIGANDIADITFHPQEFMNKMIDEYKKKLAADAEALAAHTVEVEKATHKYDDLMVQVNGLWMTFAEYNDYAKKITPVYSTLSANSGTAAQSLGALSDASTAATAGIKTMGAMLGDSTTVMKGTVDMWREFPDEMGKAQGMTVQHMIDLGVNFYDASAAVNNFVDNADAAAQALRNSSAVMAGDAANQTDFAKQVLAMAKSDMADYLAHPEKFGDKSTTSQGGNPENETPFAKAMLTAAQADLANYLAGKVPVPASGGMVMDPSTPYSFGLPNYNVGRHDAGQGISGTSFGMETVPNSGGVQVVVTGNYIMDQSTVNSLTNRVATQLTNILRQNAGLKV